MRKLLLAIAIPLLLSVPVHAQGKKPWAASLVAYPAGPSGVSVTFRSLTGSGSHVPDNGLGLAVSPPPPATVSLIVSVVTDDSVDHVSGNYFPDQANPSLLYPLTRDSDTVTAGVRTSTWSIHNIIAVPGAVLGGASVRFSGMAGPKIMSLTQVTGLTASSIGSVAGAGKGTPTSTGNLTLPYGPALLWAALGMQTNDDASMGTWSPGFTQAMRYALYGAPGGKAEGLTNAYAVVGGAGIYSAGTQ